MAADTITTEELFEVAERAEPGDSVWLETSQLEYGQPLDVLDGDVLSCRAEGGPWKAALLVLEGAYGAEHRIVGVEGIKRPTAYRSSGGGQGVRGLSLDHVPAYTKLDPDDDLGHLDLGVNLRHVRVADVVQAVDESGTQYEIADRLRIDRQYVMRLLRALDLWEAFQSDSKNLYEVQGEVLEQLRERVERPDGDDSWKEQYDRAEVS